MASTVRMPGAEQGGVPGVPTVPSRVRGWRWWAAALGFVLLGVVTTYAVAWASSLFIVLDIGERRWGHAVADHRRWQVMRTDALGGSLVEWSSSTGFKAGTGWDGEPITDDVLRAEAAVGLAHESNPLVAVPGWGRPTISDGEPGEPWVRGATSEARGWPMLAVWCTITIDPDRHGAWAAAQTPAGPAPLASLTVLDQRASRLAAGPAMPMPTLVYGAFTSPVQTRAVNAMTGTTLLAWRPMWPGFAVNTAAFAGAWALLLAGVPGARRRLRARRGLCPRCAYDLRGVAAAGCPECGWLREARGMG